jgi:hypothetical protein
MGDVDPNAERWDYGDETNWEYVRRLWDIALEEETNPPPLPRPVPAPQPTVDNAETASAWAGSDPFGTVGGYSDEPPF